jgi:hypothetical protein
MSAFAQAWPDLAIVQAALAPLRRYHNIALIEKLENPDERLWYARQAIQTGWSRNVLVHQIETKLYARQGKALTHLNINDQSQIDEHREHQRRNEEDSHCSARRRLAQGRS